MIGQAPDLPTQCPDCARKFGSANALGQHRRATHQSPGWVANAKAGKRAAPLCPKCGSAAALSQGRYGTKATCCGLWSWDLKPLVDRETHAARIQAHDAFDRIWKGGHCGRGEAYRRLQVAMGMTSDDCHIAVMTADQARRVVAIVRSGQLTEMAELLLEVDHG